MEATVSTPSPRHSLIIPAYNEARLLPRLLHTVAAARERYEGGPGTIEIIVADNQSTDRTAAIAREFGCRVATVERRVIAAARNGGAAAARGAVLSFVDADTQIHIDTFNAIDRALANPRFIAGATGVRLERWSVGIAMTYLMLVPMVLLTGMDTGVVFCRSEDFLMVGGYDERRLLAEDVAFLWALKRLGWRRRQRLTRLRPVKAIASTRKFDQFGDWHYFPMMLRAGAGLIRGTAGLEPVARRYWYDARPTSGEDQ